MSNASPLISLAAIDHRALLERLYTQIVVPEAVYAEVVLAGQGRPGADAMVTSPWITVRPVQEAVLVTRLWRQVNVGEAEAIALAVETHAELLLLDERRARALARQFALPVIGLVGVLLEAKQRGLVPAVKPLLDDLLTRSGYRLSAGLYREALLLAQAHRNDPPASATARASEAVYTPRGSPGLMSGCRARRHHTRQVNQ